MRPRLSILLGFAGLATPASAQLAINEVFENPPNGGDQTWEFIELIGPPGYDMTGYAVALVKGGQDTDPADDIPDGSNNQKSAELDEVFSLDGWTIGDDGLFVIYNMGSFGATGHDDFLIPNPGYQFFVPESPSNKRFLNGASMSTLTIPSVDNASKLGNDGSSTYLIVRKRPAHSIDASGQSVYAPGYAWKKDVTPDVDFNGRLDFGDEHTLGVPVWYANGLDGEQSTALPLEPVQIVDEISWSNAGGKEYHLSGRGLRAAKLSETPGFNPDCVSRLRYLSDPTMIGSTINESSGELEFNTLADESWVYGETVNVDPGTAMYTTYKPLLEVGPDVIAGTADDELNLLAPVDPNGPFYSYDGPGDDNPLAAPFFEFSGAQDEAGPLLFEPYDTTGFEFTPGGYNDAPAGTPLAATDLALQFRFITGDLNFDGVVDNADLAWAQSHLGASLDDTATLTRDFNTADPSDDVPYTGYAYQVQKFNALLALVRMDLSDGTTGQWDSGVYATQADVDTIAALIPACPADLDSNGSLNLDDVEAFVTAFMSGDMTADFDTNGTLNLDDIDAFVTAFLRGCDEPRGDRLRTCDVISVSHTPRGVYPPL